MKSTLAIPGVTDEVKDFYERYPYPRPVDSLEKYRELWKDEQRRLADYHLYWPSKPFRKNFSVLVAGCGTSQAAKHAMRWPEAQVAGIDFSATSVRCTEELKRKYHLENLQVHQLPLEQAHELGKSFDQVVCTGVLHHLEDPDAGLTTLRGVMKPDGVMHLMVYATFGRVGITMLKEFCRLLGVQATGEGIRDLMTALEALPAGHPLETLLKTAPDFRHEAALADALLHPRDRAYSVPELFDWIKNAGLTFSRWIKQAPYDSHCGILSSLPQQEKLKQLPIEEQYAAAELFRGSMPRHSIIVYRDDAPEQRMPVNFDGDAYLGYVPIRMPDTICVEERLPAGAAGVLINRTHVDKDLFFPITATQKKLFEAIDGRRSIRELDGSRSEATQHFFERLWQYDQVVFNTSTINKTQP